MNGYNIFHILLDNKVGKAMSAAKTWATSFNISAIGNDQSQNIGIGFNGVLTGYHRNKRLF